MKTLDITELIETQYKDFSYYVIEQRAIPSIIDGLKPVQRRILWKSKKNAKDWTKVSKLTGSTMSLHPHGDSSISSACSNMAQKFASANNICWFEGKGAFGSRISGPGNGIGAARYVSVKLSEDFYSLLNKDDELIKLKPNYDDTENEPVSFLPLIPTILLNPIQGISVGFACNILPRKLSDIIHCQQQYLNGKGFREPSVYYEGFRGKIEKVEDNVWKTYGEFQLKNKTLKITELPIGYNREQYIKILDNLEDKDVITSFTDDCKENFEFNVRLKSSLNEDEIIEKFKLSTQLNENINVIHFDGKIRKMTVSDIIKEFTDYRFSFYLNRYKKMFYELKDKFEFEKDLLTVIKKELFKKFPKLSRNEIKQLLLDNDIKEKHISRIIQVPIYKFGKDEIEVLKNNLIEMKEKIKKLVELCKSENLRKDEYKKELKMI